MLKFMQQLEGPLYQKEQTFYRFLDPFPKCALNLENLEKKDEYTTLVISRIIDSKRAGYLNL